MTQYWRIMLVLYTILVISALGLLSGVVHLPGAPDTAPIMPTMDYRADSDLIAGVCFLVAGIWGIVETFDRTESQATQHYE